MPDTSRQSQAITLIADSNIAHLADYFNPTQLGVPITLIAVAGRDMTAELIEAQQPDALLVRSVTQVDASLLQGNRSVQFVGSATIGTDHIDQTYLSQRGIAFANAAGSSKHSVAQYVLSAILTLRPEYAPDDYDKNSNDTCRSNSTDDATDNATDRNNPPVKLGIIGLGNIGSTLAAYAQDLGWQVLGHDPLLPPSSLNNVSFKALLTQSDVISLHVPLTTASQSKYPTYHLIDAHALAMMPPTTVLLNTARGAVISESALLKDSQQHQRQIVLDVFEHEPKVSQQLLQQLSIATPHIAGYTLEGKLRGTQMIFEAFVKVFADRLQLSAVSTMKQLLPPNPYYWQQLHANLSQLTAYYDIMADDALLRAGVGVKRECFSSASGASDVSGVSGAAFDNLRKNYALRREWLFNV